MTNGKVKGKLPKDLLVLAAELLAGILGVVLCLVLGVDFDFIQGFLLGGGASILVTIIIIIIKRMKGKRVLGEADEREKRIKEVAGLWSFFATSILLSILTICAFAFPSLMNAGSGYVTAAALAISYLLYVLILIVVSIKM